jgi:hypothetical protein
MPTLILRPWLSPTRFGLVPKVAREGLFVQLVMLAQLGGYRVGHDLAAMDLSGLAPVNRGVPTRIRAAVNGPRGNRRRRFAASRSI